ncbi:MAG: sigma-54 dependent transcriptional regulator [Phycisphaerales bacterium]
MNKNVMVVDSDKDSTRIILEILAQRGVRAVVTPAVNKNIFDLLEKSRCDLAFTVIRINRLHDDFRLIREIRTAFPQMPLITICDSQNISQQNNQQLLDIAIAVINAGSSDCLTKPLDRIRIENLLNALLPNNKVAVADYDQTAENNLTAIIGKSAKLIQTVSLAKKVAPTSAPVLIAGESGTGKELISYLIHRSSKRFNGPYIRVNCAALTDSLLESELFGHEKGAFTGAYSQRKGRFEMAHGGTLLLDEITETPLNFQSKLLRVLEQQDFERVGGNDSVKVDVRIISTSNKDLLTEISNGRFRQDLYYRLCGVKLIIPPLRHRCDDLPDLVWHFINMYAPQAQRTITSLDSGMLEIFANYNWPGNIRQLRNVVLTSLILGTGPKLSLADVSWLFDELQPRQQENVAAAQAPAPDMVGLPLEEVERQVILDTLDNTGGNQTKAAKILGISDRTLRSKIRQYNKKTDLQLAS